MAKVKMSSFLLKNNITGQEEVIGLNGTNIRMRLNDIRDAIGLPNPVGSIGVATPETEPEDTEDIVLYTAIEPGEYTHFLNESGEPIVLTEDDFRDSFVQLWGNNNQGWRVKKTTIDDEPEPSNTGFIQV